MDILKVNGVVVRPVRGHELSFLSGEYVKEVVILRGNNFGDKFPFICWRWFGME